MLDSFKNFYNFDKQAADIKRYSTYAYFSNNKAQIHHEIIESLINGTDRPAANRRTH